MTVKIVQRIQEMFEVNASRKSVERVRSLLARWNIVLCTLLFLALPEVLGWSQWYSNMGLMFGGVVGVPQPFAEEGNWTIGHILEVRMTATLYVAYAFAALIGLIVHAYVLPAMGTVFHRDLVSTSRRSVSLRYISSLMVSTVIVRAVVHALVASQLMPKTFKNDDEYVKYSIREMKQGFGKEPPLARYEAFAAEPPCNTVAERKLEMCTRNDGSGTGQAASVPVCSSLPCSSGEIVDTDALGGPLSTFKNLRPTPAFTTALPYTDMWRSFYDFPVVFRDVRGTGQAAAAAHVKSSNMEAHKQDAILDIDELYQTCVGRKETKEHFETRVQVGYDLENPKFSLISVFGNQYQVDLTLTEFFEHNMKCREKQESAPAPSRADYMRWEKLEDRLADVELFLHNLQNSSSAISAVAPQSIEIKGKAITVDDYILDAAEHSQKKVDDRGEVEGMVDDERRELARQVVMSNPKYCGRGYVFDSSVRQSCSALLNKLPHVKYATDIRMLVDLTVRFGMESMGKMNWPSMFIGSAGRKSRIHQDAEGTFFFLMVVAGRKLFRTVRAEDASLFADHDVVNMTARVKEIDLLSPWSIYDRFARPDEDDALRATNSTSHLNRYDIFNPGGIWSNFSSQFTVYETVLEPGDIIFIPRWGLHSAINLVDGTVSVSANFYPEGSFPFYREYCGSPGAQGNPSTTYTCQWAGLVGSLGALSSYGQAMYTGLRVLVARARIEIGSRIAESIRLLTSAIIDWGRMSSTHQVALGGWQNFFGFPANSPEECACCCSLDFPLRFEINTIEIKDSESSMLWARPLRVGPLDECSRSYFTDRGIRRRDIKPLMQLCMRHEMWQRYQWMTIVGVLPALFVTASTIVIAAQKGAFSGGATSPVLKKE